MKSMTAVILVLMVVPALAAADSTRYTSNFSLAPLNGLAAAGTASSVRLGSALAQSVRTADAGQGYRQALLTPMVSEARASTFLIIGAALLAGGVVLFEATENGDAKIAGMILIGVGGLAIYKGIEVLISSGRDRHLTYGHGSLRIDLRTSF